MEKLYKCFVIMLSLSFWRTRGSVLSPMEMNKLLSNYNPSIPPTVNDTAVRDNIQIYVVNIPSISSQKMEYEMTFYLRQRWTDYRLKYNFPGVEVIEMDKTSFYDYWTPNIYIVNQKESDMFDSDAQTKLINLYPNGEVLFSSRISGIFTCVMDLTMYPFDTQICDVKFGSYSLSSKVMMIRWQQTAVELSQDVTIPEFELTETQTFSCDEKYFGGNYTCAGLHMHLRRNKGYYMTHVYLPCILIVMLSWVSFWLGTDVVTPRISLSLLTILTMMGLSAVTNTKLPKLSYSTILDVWLAVCDIFVLVAFLEFILVNVMTRQVGPGGRTPTSNGETVKTSEKNDGIPDQKHERARRTDIMIRLLFPVAFVVFNVAYWIYCAI